jgi:hypothetical protein
MKTFFLPFFATVLLLWSGSAFAQGSAPLLTTFTNPAPAVGDGLGISVAAVGNDQVLIGTYRKKVANLFGASGALLVTFTYPNPQKLGAFGSVVAAMGSDRVLIGAPGNDTVTASAGAVYLFNTNGTLLTTFTNPIPANNDGFGTSVTAVGSDRVLVGAIDFAVTLSGTAYLFNTNGILLTTFPDPAPAGADQFASTVAAFGNDRVLIGELADNGNSGKAYLLSTSGALLKTFSNPAPAPFDRFGFSVAAVGSDRVLIGAAGQNAGATQAGVAYLFSTNGSLLKTFTNPSPSAYDSFGWSVAPVGNNRVIIGAFGDSAGATSAGTAYLFSTNGTLLVTITNPVPVNPGNFGLSSATAGNDRLLIGAYGNSSGAVTYAGAAYLFALPYPPLSITRNSSTVSVKWVTDETGLILQQTDWLGTTAVWSDSTNSVFVSGKTNIIQQTTVNESTTRFFRLRRP